MNQVLGFIIGMFIFILMFSSLCRWLSDLSKVEWRKRLRVDFRAFKVDFAFDSNTAMNHAVEHKTIRILNRKYNIVCNGLSDENGFRIGLIKDGRIVADAVQQAIDEIRRGEGINEIYRATCGTSTITTELFLVIGVVLSAIIFGFSFWGISLFSILAMTIGGVIGRHQQKTRTVNKNIQNIRVKEVIEVHSQNAVNTAGEFVYVVTEFVNQRQPLEPENQETTTTSNAEVPVEKPSLTVIPGGKNMAKKMV